jgi:hypothetical protein
LVAVSRTGISVEGSVMVCDMAPPTYWRLHACEEKAPATRSGQVHALRSIFGPRRSFQATHGNLD